MQKYLTVLFLILSSISFADHYYITYGDAALEIYEREQLKQQRIRQSFCKSRTVESPDKIEEMEKQVEEMVKRF